MDAKIICLASDGTHRFSKQVRESLRLIAGLGVEGDAHAGETVQHLSRIKAHPGSANLRQFHLIHSELLDDLAGQGFSALPGQLGENATTAGIDLLGLSRGTRLRLGSAALIEITGLRNPCAQMDGFSKGLMKATLGRSADGSLIRKAGVMAVVLEGGNVTVGDGIDIVFVPEVHCPLAPV